MELRAYICVDFNHISNRAPKVGEVFSLGVPFTNAGKTPAYSTYNWTYFKYGGTGVYENEYRELTKTAIKYEASVFGVGTQIVMLSTDKILTEEDSVKANGVYFILTKMIYTDKFGTLRFTDVCMFWNKETNNWEMYDKYNDAN